MIVLDTCAVIELLEGGAKGEKIKDIVVNDVVAITAVSMNELLIGRSKNDLQLIKNFITALHIISFDTRVAVKSSEIENDLRAKGRLIGKLDIFIAGTCLVHQLPLVTCDSDFKKISGLRVIVV